MNGLIIDYVPDYKYLGMILDRTLIWKKHIMNLKNKCVNDLRLMKIISYQGWGADGKSLYRLYSALILPKISYGAFFYDTAAKTNLMVVNRIQFEAARIILGALRIYINKYQYVGSCCKPYAIAYKKKIRHDAVCRKGIGN